MSEEKDSSVLPSKYPKVPGLEEDLNFSTLNEAIGTYVATRDALDVERKAYNFYEANAKAYMARIEGFIREKADELGMDSIRTESGTAYRSVKTQYRVADWDAFWQYIKANDYSHCVEKRAAKLAVKEIHDETGELPPGLDYHTEVVFDVRRPSK